MGIKSLIQRMIPPSWLSSLQNLYPGFSFYSAPNNSGVDINELTALTANTVWACVRVISSAISGLPVDVRDINTNVIRRDHDLYELLHYQPNPYMTSCSLWESFVVNFLLYGNGYCFIEKDESERVVGLYPIPSQNVQPRIENGYLVYYSTFGGQSWPLRSDQVLHVKGFGVDGLMGLNPIQWAKQTIGVSLALERYAASFFGNGGNIGGILVMPAGSTAAAQKAYLEEWRKQYSSVDNAFKVAALPTGYDFKPLTTSPQNAQAIEARTFQIAEIARIFGVPQHKLNELSRATFSNIEQMDLHFMGDCIRPWIIKIEQECRSKLLFETEKEELTIDFDLNALLRVDSVTLINNEAALVAGGIGTPNESRANLHPPRPPLPGGNELIAQLNTRPASSSANTISTIPVDRSVSRSASPALARSIAEDAIHRVIIKEIKAISRAITKYKKNDFNDFKNWAENFYKGHRDLVANMINHPFGMIENPDGNDLERSAAASAFAEGHCGESLEQLLRAMENNAVDDLMDEWETVRPFKIVEAL